MFKVAPTAKAMTRLARHEGGTANDLATAGPAKWRQAAELSVTLRSGAAWRDQFQA